MGGDAAGPEQPFEGVLLVAPAPPAALTLGAVDVGCGDRTAVFDFGVDVLDQAALFGGPTRQPLVDLAFVVGGGALHAPLHQRPGLDRQVGGLMRPVFEQPALAADGGVVEHRHRVGTEAREQRHVVGPDHGADRIDLQQAEPGKHAVEMTPVDLADGPGVAKALRGQARCGGPAAREIFSFIAVSAGQGAIWEPGIGNLGPTIAAPGAKSVSRIKWSILRRKCGWRLIAAIPGRRCKSDPFWTRFDLLHPDRCANPRRNAA